MCTLYGYFGHTCHIHRYAAQIVDFNSIKIIIFSFTLFAFDVLEAPKHHWALWPFLLSQLTFFSPRICYCHSSSKRRKSFDPFIFESNLLFSPFKDSIWNHRSKKIVYSRAKVPFYLTGEKIIECFCCVLLLIPMIHSIRMLKMRNGKAKLCLANRRRRQTSVVIHSYIEHTHT